MLSSNLKYASTSLSVCACCKVNTSSGSLPSVNSATCTGAAAATTTGEETSKSTSGSVLTETSGLTEPEAKGEGEETSIPASGPVLAGSSFPDSGSTNSVAAAISRVSVSPFTFGWLRMSAVVNTWLLKAIANCSSSKTR